MRFELTDEAVVDLESIFDYSEDQFGFDQAVKYLNELDSCFKFIGSNPNSGKLRSEIRKGLRSFTKDNHIIFYRMIQDTVRIVRVLHGSKDLPRQF